MKKLQFSSEISSEISSKIMCISIKIFDCMLLSCHVCYYHVTYVFQGVRFSIRFLENPAKSFAMNKF